MIVNVSYAIVFSIYWSLSPRPTCFHPFNQQDDVEQRQEQADALFVDSPGLFLRMNSSRWRNRVFASLSFHSFSLDRSDTSFLLLLLLLLCVSLFSFPVARCVTLGSLFWYTWRFFNHPKVCLVFCSVRITSLFKHFSKKQTMRMTHVYSSSFSHTLSAHSCNQRKTRSTLSKTQTIKGGVWPMKANCELCLC